MRILPGTLLAALLLSTSMAHAGVIVGGTRLIYDASKKESSLNISNPDDVPYLIQAWVESKDGETAKPPFIVTPPLFRLEGGQENVLRVVQAGGRLPTDKESLYWMSIKSIPSATKEYSGNTLQIAVKTRIKLIYRPTSIKGVAEDVTDKLSWSRSGNKITVTNPTPFYMNFHQVTFGGKKVEDVTFVAPGSSSTYAIPKGTAANKVSWKIINDYGGTGKEHSASL